MQSFAGTFIIPYWISFKLIFTVSIVISSETNNFKRNSPLLLAKSTIAISKLIIASDNNNMLPVPTPTFVLIICEFGMTAFLI